MSNVSSEKYLHRITSEYFVFELNADPIAYSFSIRALDHFTERLISFEPVYDGCVKNLNNLCDIKNTYKRSRVFFLL